MDATIDHFVRKVGTFLNGKDLNGQDIGVDGGNIYDVWQDELAGGFTFVTDNDVHVVFTMHHIHQEGEEN